MSSRQRRIIQVVSALSLKAFALMSILEDTATAQVNSERGSTGCPLDISVLWTADVESPVYSTPVIIPSSPDNRKQVFQWDPRRTLQYLDPLEIDQ